MSGELVGLGGRHKKMSGPKAIGLAMASALWRTLYGASNDNVSEKPYAEKLAG